MLTMRAIPSNELSKVKSFYRETDYSGVIDLGDIILAAEEGGEMRAAMRLCHENGCLVLRGMRVVPNYQHRGIGSQLLQFAAGRIGEEDCYCIAHRYLRNFYGQVGFAEISLGEAARFLESRVEHYRQDYELDVILMRRAICQPGS